MDETGGQQPERDHAQRLLRAGPGVLEDQLHHLVHLGSDRGLLVVEAGLNCCLNRQRVSEQRLFVNSFQSLDSTLDNSFRFRVA